MLLVFRSVCIPLSNWTTMFECIILLKEKKTISAGGNGGHYAHLYTDISWLILYLEIVYIIKILYELVSWCPKLKAWNHLKVTLTYTLQFFFVLFFKKNNLASDHIKQFFLNFDSDITKFTTLKKEQYHCSLCICSKTNNYLN